MTDGSAAFPEFCAMLTAHKNYIEELRCTFGDNYEDMADTDEGRVLPTYIEYRRLVRIWSDKATQDS